jgi:FkbM family methyltransferase
MNDFFERVRKQIARLFFGADEIADTQQKVTALGDQTTAWFASLSKKSDDYQHALGSRLDHIASKLDEAVAKIEVLQAKIDNQEAETDRKINQLLDFAGPWISEDLDLPNDPEFLLLAYLYNFLPTRSAIDVGANEGRLTELLLQAGYRVYAFEPFPPVAAKLRARFGSNPQLELFEMALGSSDTHLPLYVATETADSKIGDETLYNTFKPHFVREGLEFQSTIEVPVRSIESLVRERQLPDDIGLLKIDAEGFDLEVIRGLGNLRPSVVQTEFWGEEFVFLRKTERELPGSGQEIIQEMRSRSYQWNLIIFRIEGETPIRFTTNLSNPPKRAWGNIFFFSDFDHFQSAFQWCRFALPRLQILEPSKTGGDQNKGTRCAS